MKRGPLIVLIIILVVIAGLAIWYFAVPNSGTQTATNQPPAGTSTSTATTTPSTPAFDQSLSNGVFAISYPSSDFGLATNQTQLLVHSYIPPCDQGFNYCFYYIGSAYSGTNFESAGIRIQKRPDLATATKCLTAQPAGYTGLTPVNAPSSSDYSASAFLDLGNAAAGHQASGSVYRLFANGVCYEFETRVGQSQFANYPSGTIQEFTLSDQAAIKSELQQILSTLKLSSGGTSISLPQG